MKRNILYLLSIGICLFTCVGSHAAAPETRAHLERGRSLFDHGRWTDARYELLKAREGADGTTGLRSSRSIISWRFVP